MERERRVFGIRWWAPLAFFALWFVLAAGVIRVARGEWGLPRAEQTAAFATVAAFTALLLRFAPDREDE